MIHNHLLPAIYAHAAEVSPQECCGLVVSDGVTESYRLCRNVHPHPDKAFELHGADWAAAEDAGDIQAVVHSHVGIPPEPSMADLSGCEASGLPWLIVNAGTQQYRWIEPTGYIAPLEGRSFVWGVFDCFTLVRDYYRRHCGVAISDFGGYDFAFWEQGQDLYRERYAAAGFVAVPLESARPHDVLLMQTTRTPVANHAAVYLGGNIMLHHLQNRLSGKAVYGGYWRDHTSLLLRHETLC